MGDAPRASGPPSLKPALCTEASASPQQCLVLRVHHGYFHPTAPAKQPGASRSEVPGAQRMWCFLICPKTVSSQSRIPFHPKSSWCFIHEQNYLHFTDEETGSQGCVQGGLVTMTEAQAGFRGQAVDSLQRPEGVQASPAPAEARPHSCLHLAAFCFAEATFRLPLSLHSTAMSSQEQSQRLNSG